MALDGAAFSPKQFGLAIQAESTIGTKKTDGMRRINVDNVEMPSFNLTQVMEARSGTSGRVADKDDVLIDQKGVGKEISFSGVLDTDVAPILIQSVIAKDHTDNIVSIGFDYSPPELQTDDNSSITIADTFTLAILNPNAGNSADSGNSNMIFKGCTITSLQITGDMANESGRLRFSATAKTGYIAEFNQANPTISNSYGNNFYSLATLSGAKTIAGCIDSVVQSFSLNIENPSEYVGQHDSSGNPEAIVRAVPEISVNLDATIKYDANTSILFQRMNTGTAAAAFDAPFLLCNESGLSESGTTFGIQADEARITNLAYNEANAMMIDVSTKAVAGASGNMFSIHF